MSEQERHSREPSPQEFVAEWDARSDNARLAFAQRLIHDARMASQCFVMDHGSHIAMLEQAVQRLKAENAMLRACRESEQRAAVANLPIIAAATEGPRMWAEPDGFGEPTIWHEIAGAPQPVLAKFDLAIGSRHLWETVAARLTAGSAT